MYLMKIQPVHPITVRKPGMEHGRESVTQQLSVEMRQRISGRGREPTEPRRVEPAVRIDISEQARRVAKEQQG